MLCEVCKLPMKRIQTSLVCPNGHTIQNAVEVADDDQAAHSARRRKIKTKKTKGITHHTIDPTVGYFILIRSLYKEAMKDIGFSSDTVWKNFTGFYKLLTSLDGGEKTKRRLLCLEKNDSKAIEPPSDLPVEEKVKNDFLAFSQRSGHFFNRKRMVLNACVDDIQEVIAQIDSEKEYENQFLHEEAFNYRIQINNEIRMIHFNALVYLDKRAELESKGEIYPFSVFRKDVINFKSNEKYHEIVRKLKIKQNVWNPYPDAGPLEYSLRTMQKMVDRIANGDAFLKEIGGRNQSASHETGIITRQIENIKHNIRICFDRSIETYKKYFDLLCDEYGIEKTEDLMFYFENMFLQPVLIGYLFQNMILVYF